MALALNGGTFDANTLAQPLGFLNVEFQKYLFRNRLAQQFVTAISGSQSRRKLAFSFEMVCSPNEFMTIINLETVKKKRASNACARWYFSAEDSRSRYYC